MIDKETYDDLALQLEHGLNENSHVTWHVDDYDMRLREAQISEETAEGWGTTPAEYFDFIFNQMKIWYVIEIKPESLRGYYYVARALLEDALVNYVGIIKSLIAEQIALQLIEDKIV